MLSDIHFLAGGGEMGARMRALDWSKTPLGAPEKWPQSLKTIVRVMLDSRYAMWMLWGPEHTFFCNDAYLPTVGIKQDWVLGARSDKVWEEVWEYIAPRLARVMQGEATWDEALLLFLERSGFPEETYHTFSYSPVYDDDSRIAGMLCVVTEVTHQVQGERGLRVLRDLAAHVAGAQTVQQTCERLTEVLGDNSIDVPFSCLYLTDPAEGRAWLASCSGDVPESLRPNALLIRDAQSPWPLQEAMRTGEAMLVDLAAGEQAVKTPLWADRVTKALVMPVKAKGIAASSAVLIAGVSPRRTLDGSYRRFFELVAGQFAAALGDAQAYAAERTRAEALAALDHAKTLFFSNVSHEFRTPLTLLLGPLEETLALPDLTPDMRERLELAHRNSLRLLRLVNSLLDFSRIEAGRANASYVLTDLAALTRDLASTFRSAIERAGLAFDVALADLNEPVYVDREMWEKIVLNLLSNAFKFTLHGSITLRLTSGAERVVLEVADTGVGVPAQEIPRLFERFHRVESTQGRTHEGSGIGLALVQELVQLHGGSIEVESVLGFGTTFRVCIPRGTAHLPADRIRSATSNQTQLVGAQAFVQEALRWTPERPAEMPVSREAPGATSAPQNQRFAGTFGARVLLADDNADMRDYVTTLLAPHYQVEVVADGAQALAAALRQRPDLILSDVMMPQVDGFELLKHARATESLRDIPVILLSARAGEESRIEGLDAGADDYLVKPFSARELLARVGAMLERDRFHRQSLEQLETADRQKNEFLAMLAHELRNPLAPIRNASELLSRTVPDDPRVHAAIGIVKRQVTHLTRLVDDLLDVSRITQGRIELRRKPLALADVISQALETVEPLFRERRHRVSVTLSFDPLPVNGDPARLIQCVANILTNAAKYTDPNGVIRIESHADDGHAVLTVTDSGTGIPAELLPRVFDLFVQSKRTLDRSQGGLGIGLSVVKRLIEMHGGTVSATSDGLGLGSTFTIRLPLIERGAEHADEAAPRPPDPRRILVVDDNPDVAESLAMLLALDRHDVQSVFTPNDALARVQSFKPQIVLLDIGLPGIDGYEVARRIRALPDANGVRLVALTGYGQAEDRQRAHEAGFDDHLVKPVDLTTLQRALIRLD